MRHFVVFVLLSMSVVAHADCATELGSARETAAAPRSRAASRCTAAAAILFGGLAGCAVPPEQGKADPATDWDKARPAEVVAKGTASLVYRFVDEVDGKKMLCYFVESYYETESGRGGITCVSIP